MPRSVPLLLLAGGLLVLTTVVRSQTVPQVPQVPGGAAGSTASDLLFDKIYPVFASPRCVACHGVVKHYPGFIYSVTPATHPGGPVGAGLPDPVVDCETCHDAVGNKWITAPPNMEWLGMDKDSLCIQQAAEVRLKNLEAGGESASLKKSYLHHISSDELVQQSWVGRAGGARGLVDKDKHPQDALLPPPMPYADFLQATDEWVKAGAPCRATGQLTMIEEQSTLDTATTPVGQQTQEQKATREVHIVRNRDGSATATIKASGFNETTTKMPLGSCEMTTVVRDAWSRTGPATAPAKLEFTVKPNEYTIHFSLFEETTHTDSTTKASNTCGIPMPPTPASGVDLTWPAWVMDLRCPTEFPNHDGTMGCIPSEPHDKGVADGAWHQTVKYGSEGSDPRAWLLHSPMAVGSVTGQSVPVHVTISWSVRLNQK